MTQSKSAAAKKADEKAQDEMGYDPAADLTTADSATPEEGGVKESGPIVETADTAEPAAANDDGLKEVTLAHPITRDQDKILLGLETETKCNVGDKIRVSLDNAIRLINAGLVQVDPEDQQAVHAVLTGKN